MVFAKVKNDTVSVASVWNLGSIRLYLIRRDSNAMRLEKKNQIIDILNSINFSEDKDSTMWQ